MSRNKTILAVIFFLGAALLYCYIYRDAFRRPVIVIRHTHERTANARRRPANASTSPKPVFDLGRNYQVTSLKVIQLDELKAKGFAHPIWELVTKSNSTSVRFINYGRTISGMQPAIPGAPAEPLTNNVTYRLLVVAGKLKGQHDFTPTDEDYPGNEAP